METSQNSSNVTGTGIAVALAVIVALGLLFFGPKLFTFITNQPVATNSNPVTQNQLLATTTTNTTTMTDTNTPAAAPNPASEIPANPTELMIKDIVVGTGAEAKSGDTVTVNYVGKLTNGTVFDASANHGTTGFSFPLGAGRVIKGWDQGVAGMKVGGKRELVIPASLGYADQAVGSIPANSTLVFEVDLLDVK
jgi:FKBP-type peptidyl-prolyl cis-trans isomerase